MDLNTFSLADSGMLSMEIVGEFLRIDTERRGPAPTSAATTTPSGSRPSEERSTVLPCAAKRLTCGP